MFEMYQGKGSEVKEERETERKRKKKYWDKIYRKNSHSITLQPTSNPIKIIFDHLKPPKARFQTLLILPPFVFHVIQQGFFRLD